MTSLKKHSGLIGTNCYLMAALGGSKSKSYSSSSLGLYLLTLMPSQAGGSGNGWLPFRINPLSSISSSFCPILRDR
ncbi:hypothetical protein CENSYa_1020 [Cenarchaeum symbiosum A]|uniref:Uncharacterized protein n=1 Tax=Cenarchaeum symbiosum (strain A) TaxID=414004 RepID=A0RWD5_CENSY|nr:hypothetical protein CENSYa_1020 [Cenarchaeum symbiosum A]